MPNRSEAIRRNGRPRHHSIFFKLFIVLLGAVLLTYMAFGGFYRSEWNSSVRVRSHPSLIYYWGQLAESLGNPPDTARAASLSRSIGLAIGISGPSLNWHSDNFSGAFQMQANDSLSKGSVNMYMHSGRVWAVIPKNGYTYLFGTRRRSALEGLSTDSIALLTVIGLVWLLTWIILRHMLRPLISLESGVEAVERGYLDVQIPAVGRDEFSRLAHSFNDMTRSLRERLKSRDQLLLDVSHELRSPLTRMRLALEITDPGRALEKLRKETGLLEQMVSEILETERMQSPRGGLNLVPIPLEPLVREKVAQFSEQGVKISLTVQSLPPVPVDDKRIRQVLQNIFENAVKYGPNEFRPMKVSLYPDAQYAVVEVQDFGIGIPEKDLPYIFEPFYRADPSRSRIKGYGLGLGLCKRIVELHGGKMFVHSHLGEGTVVTVKLPLG
jgi:signal transduction histidine kinase